MDRPATIRPVETKADFAQALEDALATDRPTEIPVARHAAGDIAAAFGLTEADPDSAEAADLLRAELDAVKSD